MSKLENMKEGKILIVISSSLYFQSGIREFMLHVVTNLTELPEKWGSRMQMVVDELCSNAVEYGSAPSDEIAVTIELKKGEYLDIIVEDKGTGTQKVKAEDLRQLVDERKDKKLELSDLRGRGLAQIILKWVDELEFEDRQHGGIKSRARKYFKNAV